MGRVLVVSVGRMMVFPTTVAPAGTASGLRLLVDPGVGAVVPSAARTLPLAWPSSITLREREREREECVRRGMRRVSELEAPRALSPELAARSCGSSGVLLFASA